MCLAEPSVVMKCCGNNFFSLKNENNFVEDIQQKVDFQKIKKIESAFFEGSIFSKKSIVLYPRTSFSWDRFFGGINKMQKKD